MEDSYVFGVYEANKFGTNEIGGIGNTSETDSYGIDEVKNGVLS